MVRYSVFALILLLAVFYFVPTKQANAYYFGGQVKSWQKDSQCPAVEASNKILSAICGATFGVICLNINYGDLEVNSLTNTPSIDPNAKNVEHIGLLSINHTLLPQVPLYLYKSYLLFNPTKPNKYVLGKAIDFAPSCNPCTNKLLRNILKTAGLDIGGACGNFFVKAAITAATAPCNAAMSATSNSCPTKLMCYVGSSSIGLPRIPDINLCSVF